MLVIEENPCTLDEFACRNRQCVPLLQVCDGILHCSDGSDESSCQIRPGRGWFWFKLTFNMFCPTVLKSLVNWCWFWTGVLALFTFIIFHLTSFFCVVVSVYITKTSVSQTILLHKSKEILFEYKSLTLCSRVTKVCAPFGLSECRYSI